MGCVYNLGCFAVRPSSPLLHPAEKSRGEFSRPSAAAERAPPTDQYKLSNLGIWERGVWSQAFPGQFVKGANTAQDPWGCLGCKNIPWTKLYTRVIGSHSNLFISKATLYYSSCVPCYTVSLHCPLTSVTLVQGRSPVAHLRSLEHL